MFQSYVLFFNCTAYRYVNTEPESIPLVAEWETNCNVFQKMLLIRSCRPDRISFCIASFIVLNLGQRFVEPPVLNLKAVLDDSVPQTPLIFVLSPGVDPTGTLTQLVDSQEMTKHFMTLSLGQGQAPIATRFNYFFQMQENKIPKKCIFRAQIS